MIKCNYRCDKCEFPDCINDNITETEIMEIEARDISYGSLPHGKSNKVAKNKSKK